MSGESLMTSWRRSLQRKSQHITFLGGRIAAITRTLYGCLGHVFKDNRKLPNTQTRGKLSSAAAFTRRDVSACAQTRATFATGPRQADTTFYEFRTYHIRPPMMSEFMRLTNENIHFRIAHSELVGYFTMELGGLNKVFHIWKYDSFAQRIAVRAKLSQDKDFTEKYIAKALPMMEKQDNEIAYLVPWCKLQKSEKAGVYELVSFQFKPGGPAVWGDAFKAAISTHVNTGYTKLVGAFNTEYGLLNQVHVLWWHENADSRAAGRHLAHEDARVVAAVRESVRFLESQKSVLLLPTAFSPLK
ncbi:protein NipSnap homolog 3A-like [Pelodytes ibericus]